MIKILGISGTLRKNGNSDILLENALKPFEDEGCEVKHIRLSDLTIHPCRGCEACRQEKGCIIKDDMHLIYDAFAWCDAIIISSPVYYRNLNSALMSALERQYAVLEDKILEGKVGGAIAVGRGDGQANTINAIYTWMLSCGIICVPGELNGVTATASEPLDILYQEKKLKQAEILGLNVLSIAKKLR